MEPLAAILVVLSAILHPLWNAVIKREAGTESAFVAMIVWLALIALAHAGIAGASIWPSPETWPPILISTFGQLFYGFGVVATLKRGDLSAYYPIIRASPLFVVAAGFAMGERYAPEMLLGVALVLAGSFALQYERGRRFDPIALAWAVLAMAMGGVYVMADARAVTLVDPIAVMFWCQFLSLPFYGVYYARVVPGWQPLAAWRRPWRPLAAGLMCYGSYYLVLLALLMGASAAAVTSVRQISIPLSVVIGGMFLSERGMARRLAAALVLAAGILAVVMAR